MGGKVKRTENKQRGKHPIAINAVTTARTTATRTTTKGAVAMRKSATAAVTTAAARKNVTAMGADASMGADATGNAEDMPTSTVGGPAQKLSKI